MTIEQQLQQAMEKSQKIRPAIGGFPYLADCLRQAGFLKNTWYLPSGDSFYFTSDDALVIPGTSLIEAPSPCPIFHETALIKALKLDQAGQTTFPDFLKNIWSAGVVMYTVDFIHRSVTYYGADNTHYQEDYPSIT